MRAGLALLLVLLGGCGVKGDLAEGRRALDRGDLVTAEAAYRHALDRAPDEPEALYGLAWTWHLAGQRDAARGAFQQLVSLHPDSPLGYKGLATVLLSDGNVAAARAQLEEARQRAPGDPTLDHSLALVELSAGDGAAALGLFEGLLAKEPERSEFLQGKAEALIRLDRGEDAVPVARAAEEHATTPKQRVLAQITRARALLSATGRRVDPKDCSGTAPPVFTWLDEADRVLDDAEAAGMDAPELVETRRMVHRRRAAVDDACPGLRVSGGGG